MKIRRDGMRRAISAAASVLAIVLAASAAAQAPTAAASKKSAAASTWASSQQAAVGEWNSYGGTNWSQKYSPLDQVTKDNFKDLKIAWTLRSPDHELLTRIPPYPEQPLHANGMKATPLLVKGVMYVSTGLGQIAALDPVTGQIKWLYNPEAYKGGAQADVLGWQSRGVSYWTDGKDDERILMGTLDGYLLALDARTGKPIQSFGVNGKADLTPAIRGGTRNAVHLVNGERHFISVDSPPVVVRDTVVVGSTMSDRTPIQEWPPGDVQAFDVRTGKLKWVFHVIPKDGEFGANTWKNHSNRYTGNGNVWSMMSGDDELGYVYLPTTTPNSDFWGGARKGDNLFAESIVAVNVETGKRVWHFQAVHHGLWDYDFPAAPTLLDVTVNGKKIKALAQASKQAFLYVFDRVTGKPVWPIEERAVPAGDVPGEWYSPTQPFPTRPPAFDRQGMTEDNILDFTPELHAQGLDILSHYKHGGLFTPPSLYKKDGTWGTIDLPGDGGGANWSGSGADPETGYLYVPSRTNPAMPTLVALPKDLRAWPTREPLEGTPLRYVPQGKIGPASIHPDHPPPPNGPQGLPLVKPPYSRLTAYNLNTGDIAWQVPTGNGAQRIRSNPALKGLDLPPLGGQGGSGGVLVTRTLLIYGLVSSGAPGEPPGKLVAYDKATGATLAELPLPASPLGTPMTYLAGGKQYIALTLQGGQLVALAVDAGAANATPALSVASSGAAPSSILPAGPGRNAVTAICSSCHSPDIVASVRLDRPGWESLAREMIDRGGSATSQQMQEAVDYLSANFAPAGAAASTTP
jgi:quinoprotein glucose dehydrogenase